MNLYRMSVLGCLVFKFCIPICVISEVKFATG